MYVLDEGSNSSELSISRHERVKGAYTHGLQLYYERCELTSNVVAEDT